jgi:hypothetical protein
MTLQELAGSAGGLEQELGHLAERAKVSLQLSYQLFLF